MKTYFTYIVKCSDNSYYTGITNNIENRINEHNLSDDKKAYTYSRRPVVLVYSQSFNNVHDAIQAKKKSKDGPGRKKKL